MKITVLRNREALEAHFRHNIALHAYSLGDLDDIFWPRTTYFGQETPAGVDLVSVLYRGEGLPVLLALEAGPARMDRDYVAVLSAHLPGQFYAHLSPGLEAAFSESYAVEDQGKHIKMELEGPIPPLPSGPGQVIRLTAADLPEMESLYAASYPGNAFDPWMVETGMYYGCRAEGRLVSAGGVHVYSKRYRTAVLGNITTHPKHRNQGMGRLVTSRICMELAKTVSFIGLNVKADNQAALKLYHSLGFKFSAYYGEFTLKKAV